MPGTTEAGTEEHEPNQSRSAVKKLIFQQMLGISIVALILTILEVFSLVQTVFPDLREFALHKLGNARMHAGVPEYAGLDLLKPALQTLGQREREASDLTNAYITYFAMMFCVIMLITIFFFRFRIVQEANARGENSGLLTVYFFALLTLLGIMYFQGVGCLLGLPSACSRNSFVSMTNDWQNATPYQQVVLSTGICNGIPGLKT